MTASRRVDLDNRFLNQVAGHVEIVNRHVEEQTARDLDVVDGRRLGISTRDPEHLRRADLAASNASGERLEVRIETAIEAHLQTYAGRVDGTQRRADLLEVVIDGLLAEDVFSCRSRIANHACVSVRRRTDDDRVDVGSFQDVPVVPHRVAGVARCRRGTRTNQTGVGHHRNACAWNMPRDVLGVQHPDATRTNDSHTQLFAHEERLPVPRNNEMFRDGLRRSHRDSAGDGAGSVPTPAFAVRVWKTNLGLERASPCRCGRVGGPTMGERGGACPTSRRAGVLPFLNRSSRRSP